MPESESPAETIFFAAIERETPEERARYVQEACAGDEALRRQVERLLRAQPRIGDFLQAPAAAVIEAEADLPTHLTPAAPMDLGTLVGPYKLLQQIGEGGMAVVFLAEQTRPIQRKVALKVIKPGRDSRQVIARFEAERQALALMDHPNIAKVLDAGTTDACRPYFVMELVKGVPITAYCDENHLSPSQRLELFVQVCSAVQHAHQKGIIHRDLKPSNVLVALYDGKPVPKVIDFGIAKAIGQPLTERTMFTGFGDIIGTLEYMSPEQAQLNQLDVDTRSDIYSLGVVLYELLTGTTPLERRRVKEAALLEMLRVIREEEPPKPSTRLSTTEHLPSISANRGLEPRKLSRLVHGELDWIVMKALEKDRTRRYETASGLATDIVHYLSDEPVLAKPTSTAYRLRKFIRRHKGPVIATALFLTILIGGVIGTTLGLIGQARQRVIAEQQTAIAQAISQFQSDMLSSADPERLLGDQVTVLRVVTAAVEELDAGRLKDQPLVEAGVRLTIGNTLRVLGRYDAAEPNIGKALELRRQRLPAAHPDLAECLLVQGLLLRDQGHFTQAEPLLREALASYRNALPAQPQYISLAMKNLAILLMDLGKYDESESLLRDALSLRRRTLDAGNSDIADSLQDLAHILFEKGRHKDAELLIREAMDIIRASFPPNHPKRASTASSLAELLLFQGRRDEAEPLAREALEIRRNAFPAGHPVIARSLGLLARVVASQGKLEEAESLVREALKVHRAALPPGHRQIGKTLTNLAIIVDARGQFAEAVQLARESLDISRRAYGPGHPEIAIGAHNLGHMLQLQGKLDEAEPLLREALEISRKTRPHGYPGSAKSVHTLARLLVQQGKADEAEPLLRESVQDLAQTFGKDHWRVAISRVQLANALVALDRRTEAETELLESERILASTSEVPLGRHQQCVEALVQLYTTWEQSHPRQGHDAKAVHWRAKLPATQPVDTPATQP